jgi:hypothetical protein
MLRGVEHGRAGFGGQSVRQRDGGLGAVVPVPLTPRRKRRSGTGTLRVLGAAFLLGAFGWGAAAMFDIRAEPTSAADCTALALDRDTGQTEAVSCAGAGPSRPSTLTALLRTGLPDAVAATR